MSRDDSDRYLSILSDHLHSFMSIVHSDISGQFQQDNATPHPSRVATKWLQEHSSVFRHFHWPPKSPEMNIIEDILDDLLHAVEKTSPPPRTPMDFLTALQDSWREFSPGYLQTPVESMPSRFASLACSWGPDTILRRCKSFFDSSMYIQIQHFLLSRIRSIQRESIVIVKKFELEILTVLNVLDLPESEKHNFGIMSVCLSVCVSVCEHDNSKTIRATGMKFAVYEWKLVSRVNKICGSRFRFMHGYGESLMESGSEPEALRP
ncbi:hypothetical protein AVEN_99384-1 [Araneus ventricosus]|uniref:Tc1-like transposase DDE domain-containing protein n=1 Tax=Araneus ventricosus TaxID=182803 RepID=A0A4Y2GPI4_ARAVE|nr:hypothetical protein AVEN_99384-1 [Araneus ventricosus]